MRELVILGADSTMVAVLRSFFGRERWDLTLQCQRFDVWPQEDIFHDPMHTDGGVHKSAHELLRPYLNTHRRALVVLDQQYGGELPAHEVHDEIVARLSQTGWGDRCEVVVIDPELEIWLWQDNPNVERALNFSGGSLRRHLEGTGAWPADAPKPTEPKETIQALVRQRSLKTKVVYTRIADSISVHGCTDPSFELLAGSIRRWFPQEAGA